ncbi:anoctamin-4 [Grus japonensis]|uniref:Anoctamin-4 n=1 Tax=Grus japonensis TaxID=30415 RepID=A0ABC9VXX2_GRUJA
MPAGCKMDLPLAKAEPISDGGSTSGITYLKEGGRGGKLLWKSSQKRGVRMCERNNSADTKVSAEGGGGGAPGTRVEIPLQPLEKTIVRQAVPLQPMEVHSGADIHLQPVEDPMLEQVEAPEGDCDPVGSLCWSRLLAGPVERGAHAGAEGREDLQVNRLETQIWIKPDIQKTDVDFSEILNAIQEIAKDVNIFFDELEGVNSPSKDDDSLLHHGNLTSTSDDASRLEVVGEEVPDKNKANGLYFRDGKCRIDYILVYRKSNPQTEKREVFERNIRAEGLQMEKEGIVSQDEISWILYYHVFWARPKNLVVFNQHFSGEEYSSSIEKYPFLQPVSVSELPSGCEISAHGDIQDSLEQAPEQPDPN